MSFVAGHKAEKISQQEEERGWGMREWKVSEIIQSMETGMKRVMVEKTLMMQMIHCVI